MQRPRPPPPQAWGRGLVPGWGDAALDRAPAKAAGACSSPGWALMTPQERTEHQAKMRSMKTHEECNAYMVEHKVQIATRAAERNVQLRTQRRDPCAMFAQ